MLQLIAKPLRQVDVAWFLAIDDIKGRFARTVLGPLWIVVANIGLVAGITVVFGALFQTPIREFVVYVSFGVAIWTFIQSIMVGASKYFKDGSNLLFTYHMPWSVQIVRKVMVESIILFMHLVVAAIVVVIAVGVPSILEVLFSLSGIAASIVFGLGVALIVASYGIRYLDLGYALETIMMFLFLFTPVFWTYESLDPTRMFLVQYNPLFHFLEAVRAPLVDGSMPLESLAIVFTIAPTTLAIGCWVYASRRPTIGSWMQ